MIEAIPINKIPESDVLPTYEPFRVESIVSQTQILGSLEKLLFHNEITQYQFENLISAIEYSRPIYEVEPRRDGFRNHANGHVFPAVNSLINNRGRVIEIVKDEVSQINDNIFIDGNLDQKSLYYSILLMITHDWYEGLEKQGKPIDETRKFVKSLYGETVDQWIDLLTKPKKGQTDNQTRNRQYYERLNECDSKMVALIKFEDRNSNHNDDFGIANPVDIVRYCSESLENLLPWFERVLPIEISKYFEKMVFDLIMDANDSDILLQIADEIATRNLKDKRSDGSTWVEHTSRMEELIKRLGLRRTVGFMTLIKLHDITSLDEENNVILKSGIDEEEIIQLIKVSPIKALYSIGLIYATKELEVLMTRYLRDVNYSYQGNSAETIEKIKRLYSKKVFLNDEEFKRDYRELTHVEPLIQEQTMQQMLEWDIESLLVLVLERLDNLNNPVLAEDAYGNIFKNSAYQWKTAQELLFLHPLLELGGFTELATYARGQAMEYLDKDSEFFDLAKQEYNEHLEFASVYDGAVSRSIIKSTRDVRTTIRNTEKRFGNALRKKYDAHMKGEGIEAGDYVRRRVIYTSKDRPYDLAEVLNFVGRFETEFKLETGIDGLTIELQNPRPEIRENAIHINARKELNDRNRDSLSDLSPERAKNVVLKDVDVEQYEFTQVYIKINGIPGFANGVFMEIQLLDTDSFERGVIGDAAHYLYKYREKNKRARRLPSQETEEPSISKRDLRNIFLRMAEYRSSWRSHLYLTEKSLAKLKKIFPFIEYEFDLDELTYKPSNEDDEIVVKYVLQEVC